MYINYLDYNIKYTFNYIQFLKILINNKKKYFSSFGGTLMCGTPITELIQSQRSVLFKILCNFGHEFTNLYCLFFI